MSPHASIAHYRMISKLGQGGMGEVWRATDTKLGRDVAVKILPEVFANDPDRMARFQREAQVLASLNHPNIAVIHGVEERALIMELVEGPTLEERLAAGPMPLAEAAPIARQISEALEYAHDRGVIHRDLKPANIKVTPDGQVKVLDFGLAAVAQAAAPEAANSMASPTLTMRATMAGVIMGTAAYMSPEQASAKPVDKRADIWSFGVVLWEMLTGRQLFSGETISHTLADVLRAEIDLGKLPSGTPPAIRELLRRCLERDVKTRLRDIGEARVLLARPLAQEIVPATAAAPRRASMVPWILAGVLAVAGAALAVIHFREAPPAHAAMRFTIPSPDKAAYGAWLALSPDGRNLGFTAAGTDGVVRIWIRPLDSLDSRPLAGTDAVNTFFWSPDSRFVVFATNGKLRKIEIASGPAQTLCDYSGQLLGGTWNAEGVIVAGHNLGNLVRVPATGGTATPLTVIDRSREEITHSYPTFLPDGRHFVYLRRSARPEASGIYVGSVDVPADKQSLKRIQAAEFSVGYAPPIGSSAHGHLLFLRDGALMAQPFDESRLETAGEAVVVADQVSTNLSRAAFSVSPNGALIYRSGQGASSQLQWVDREGRELSHAGELANYSDLALSPDGSRVAHSLRVQGIHPDVWVLDLARGANTRLSFVPEGADSPAWSPDGKRLAFSSDIVMGGGPSTVSVKDASNSGVEEPVVRSPEIKMMNDWSRDGRFLIYSQLSRETGQYRLMAVPVAATGGERKPFPLVVGSNFAVVQGQVSPDSRWLAYASSVAGRYEIYVRPFPPGDGRTGQYLISTEGGAEPRWRGDGKELFWATVEGKIMAVDVMPHAGEAAFQSGAPRLLFARPGISFSTTVFHYDVTRDGKRFLMLERAAGVASTPATLILNWQAALRR